MKARFEAQKEMAKKAFNAVKEDPVNPKHVLAVAALILIPALAVTYSALTHEDKVITASEQAPVVNVVEDKPVFDTSSFEGRVLAAAQDELKTKAKLSDTKAQATKALLSLSDTPDNRVTFMINSMNSIVFDLLSDGLKFERCVELSKSENTYNCFLGFNAESERQSKEAFLVYDYPDYIYGVAFTFKDDTEKAQILDFQVGYTSNPDFKARVSVNPPTNLDGTLITSGSGDSNELPKMSDGEFLPGTDTQTLLDSYKPKDSVEEQTPAQTFEPGALEQTDEPMSLDYQPQSPAERTQAPNAIIIPEMPLGNNAPGFMKPAQPGQFPNSLNPMAATGTSQAQPESGLQDSTIEREDGEVLYTRPVSQP